MTACGVSELEELSLQNDWTIKEKRLKQYLSGELDKLTSPTNL